MEHRLNEADALSIYGEFKREFPKNIELAILVGFMYTIMGYEIRKYQLKQMSKGHGKMRIILYGISNLYSNVSFIYSIADDYLHDVDVRGKYRDAILPI